MSYFYTPSELAYLREHYADTSNDMLGKVLNRNARNVAQKARKLGLSKSAQYMANHATRFAPGLQPWNKGVRLSARLGLVADAKGLTNTQADAEGMGVFNEPREAWRKGST